MKRAIEKITDSLDLLDAYGEEYDKISAAKSMLASALDDLRKIGTAFRTEKCQGMTMRDWFAGQALAGIAFEYFSHDCNTGSAKADMRDIAHCAYLCADFMLVAREGKDAFEKT